MLNTVWASVSQGRIVTQEPIALPEGTRALVTFLLEDDEMAFWRAASGSALAKIWDNDEDDVYAQLLEG